MNALTNEVASVAPSSQWLPMKAETSRAAIANGSFRPAALASATAAMSRVLSPVVPGGNHFGCCAFHRQSVTCIAGLRPAES